jgi:hypothetical protein
MGGLEAHLFARLHQFVLEVKDSLPRARPRFQLLDIERLGELIIGTRIQSGNDVLFRFFCCEQYHKDMGIVPPFPFPSYQLLEQP